MATVWLRHPRYSLLILFTLITTFYLLFVPHEHPTQTFHVQDNSLGTRVQRSHAIYDKLLVQRERLLKKWGPNPKDIHLYVVLFAYMKAPSEWFCSFPPDKSPWPPYTVCKLYIFNSSLFFTSDTCQGISSPLHSTAHMRWSVTVLWGTAGSGSAVFRV